MNQNLAVSDAPDTQPTPENLNFSGTRKKIFDRSIELFALAGYENVSIREIANAVEIKQASIYNHFSGKQNILDVIYEYYVENFNVNQRSIEEMKELLKTSTKEEFCSALMFTFESENQEEQVRMILITKIIYMRLYQDTRARDIFLNYMNAEVEKYVVEILKYGISIGVINEFDTETYAKFLVGQRHIMGIKAFADPNYEPQQLDEEKRIMKMSSDMLPFVSK